jgi:hypothetical protein
MRGGVVAQEALGQQRAVALALAQGRDGQHEHGQPMVEVGAKRPGGDLGAQVLLRRRDQLHVDRRRAQRSEAADALLLDRLQHLALHRDRERVDLVEEERAAGGRLEKARLGALGVGERSRLETEQLRLQHRLGNRGAVHVDERPRRPRPAVVHDPSDEPLAGARLAFEEHGRDAPAARRVETDQARDLIS